MQRSENNKVILRLRNLVLSLTGLFIATTTIFPDSPSAQNGTKLPFPHDIALDFMGGMPGAAMVDIDNDGDLDIYVANGGLNENYLLDNDGFGNFSDIAERAGVDGRAESHGVSSADIDNDGYMDILVANNLQNYLYHNNGNGTFTDIARTAGMTSRYFSSTVAFADIDNDGNVDVYVGGADVDHGKGTGEMFLNNGDLSFTNVTGQTGTAATYSWSARFCDYDNDGDPDLFTANDQGISKTGEWSPIMLFRNEGDLEFTDVTRSAGLGITGSWMGLAFADYDQDGDFDFFATNLGNSFMLDTQDYDHHGFFENNGFGSFTNVAARLNLAEWDFGWGAVFTDFDNDGDPDLYYAGNFPMLHSYNNPGHLFIKGQGDVFSEETEKYGMQTLREDGTPTMAMGVAVGDVNNDGHADIFVANAGQTYSSSYPLLFTQKFDDNFWIRVKLEGTVSNRAAIGTKVKVTVEGKTQIQEVASGGSSFSQHSLWLTFGLGSNPSADRIEIIWPSGIVQTFESVAANQTFEILEALNLPVITLSAEQLDFEQVEVGRAAVKIITVLNEGKGTLLVEDLKSDAQIQFSETSFEVLPGGSRDITLTLTRPQEGDFSGTIDIVCDDPDRPTISVPISGTAVVIYANPKADFNGDNQISLSDFVAFARAFNGSDALYDLNNNGRVDFADFVVFVQSFGRPIP